MQRFADPKAAAQFVAKGFAGINSYPEERRAYPQGTVGSQVVGYAGTDNKGLAGLEVEYDKRLPGKPGKQTIVRDPFGRAIDIISATAERQGTDLFTTIDHTIQANAEAVLRQTVSHWGAKAATAVVLDPRTGAVLAMAQAPGYDANKANRVLRAAAQPGCHRHVRARLDVQARHDRGRALRPASSRPTRSSRCRTRSRSPTASSTTPRSAGPRR